MGNKLKNLLLGFLVVSPLSATACNTVVNPIPATNMQVFAKENISESTNFIVKSKNSVSESNTEIKKISVSEPAKINSISEKINRKITINPNIDQYSWNLKSVNADRKLPGFPESNITIAVIDTGVDNNHPLLKDRLLPLIDLWKETEGDDVFTYENVRYDFNGKDGNGHGTHVTGIICKILDSVGAKGITILPVKVADYTGKTTPVLLAGGIFKAVEKGARVINMSLGGQISEGREKLEEAVNYASGKGVVIVSSTGNESTRRFELVKKVTIPASFPNVISVASINSNDNVSDFSNGGPEVDIAAPGGEDEQDKIYSSWPAYRTYESLKMKVSDNYAFLSGTSIACPHVAAAAALVLAENPGLSSDIVKDRLLSTADDIEGKGFDNATGYGKLNVYKALTLN